MSSIIEGYNYDIFISYRQKDNKYDGWVTEFVENLKKELEATFKEQIGVYFDINPSDYLLETYDVDASLKDKLKCLVFIPIISRTYCDPKSFAWEYEFKAFVEQASQDKFGLKIKLPGGNVASRVLPVQIHEIAAEDKAHIEKELGGILRPIEFIYKEPGVNRPLRGNEDHPDNNLNKTFYRNQINKVANAIDEIINSLKNFQAAPLKGKPQSMESSDEVRNEEEKGMHKKPAKTSKRKLLSRIVILAVLIVAGIIAYPKIFKKDTLERLKATGERISVAVIPFQNLTNDTTWNVWGRGIQDILITQLSNSGALELIQSLSINSLLDVENPEDHASITQSVAKKISKELHANFFISGSINQAGTKIRLNAQVISPKTEKTIETFQLEGPAIEDDIFNIIDSLSGVIKDFFEVSELKVSGAQYSDNVETRSPEAYREYLAGINAVRQRDWNTSVKHFLNALDIDSNMIPAKAWLGIIYAMNFNPQGRQIFQELFKERERVPDNWQWLVDFTNAFFFIQTPDALKRWIVKYSKNENQDPIMIHYMGLTYYYLEQYTDGISEYERALKIYKDWKIKPFWSYSYSDLLRLYHRIGQYNNKEKKLYIQAEKDFPSDFPNSEKELASERERVRAIQLIIEGDTAEAIRYIDKFISISRKDAKSEAYIAYSVAGFYNEAKMLDTAEEYYRKALSLEPKNASLMDILGSFLINNDRNISEGLALIDKVLEINPNSSSYLHMKGWGLYKQGKYKESLDFLQKSSELRRQYGWYNHAAYLHLEAAKKAVAGLK